MVVWAAAAGGGGADGDDWCGKEQPTREKERPGVGGKKRKRETSFLIKV